MSLGINTTTSEGIVLAADSRQSYRNQKGMSRVGSDSASKVFQLADRVGLIVTGLAFLPENGTFKNISKFIEDFIVTHDLKKMTVSEIGNELEKYFKLKYIYKPQLTNLAKTVRANLTAQGAEIITLEEKESHVECTFKDSSKIERKLIAGVEQLQFIVSGFNRDDSHQTAVVYVPGNTQIKRDSKITNQEYGADWIGQTDVIARIILGFDVRIQNLPFVDKMIKEITPAQVQAQLNSLQYVIQWGTMTLQDGIDFSTLAIETTTAIQRFSDGIVADPGDMPGVGGKIDVAVITRDKGFVWISKKNLIAGNSIIDLKNLPNVT